MLGHRNCTDQQTELPEEDQNGYSEMTALYCPGPRGIEFKIDAEGNRSWYLYDGLGSVLAEVDDSGSMTAVRSYDVYGGLRAGSDQGSGSQKFCGSLGHSTEPSTGLIYMRARWYDPWQGRFVSEDPAGDGGNWYAYCANQPTNGVDATGECFGVVIGLAGILMSSVLWNYEEGEDGIASFKVYKEAKDLIKALQKFNKGVGKDAISKAIHTAKRSMGMGGADLIGVGQGGAMFTEGGEFIGFIAEFL